MLECIHLTKTFGKKVALDHVTFTLTPGHIYALLGPNGSGKTTYMKMVAGLVKPTSGEIRYLGDPLALDHRNQIAYMSTEPYFYSYMTIRDVGKYYADFFADYSDVQYKQLLEKMELTPDLKVKTLSSGMMAKLKIAVTLARDAKLYMLDEPFNGIDLLARDEIRSCIVNAALPEKILILSSHLVEEMEAIADHAIFLKSGKLIEVRELEEMRMQEGISMTERYRAIYGHTEE